ncbi:MAG: phosphoenolpyruvate-dependent sugar phosphotransferase system 2 [Planctomycetaceae bacterium]|nr:phosphoenolpyruvate-dependent sugar phosphotransferase system 2 [Planctomycetaceae bacterium]
MKLTEFIYRSVILGPEIRTLEQAISAMLEGLSSNQLPPHLVPEILAAVMRREKTSSTAIGRGMAIPHAGRLPIDRVVGVVAVSESGIEADSIDGRPVSVVILLLLPPPPPNEHRLYRPETEVLWRFLRNDEFYSCLRQARTEEEIEAVLKTADATFAVRD